MAQISREIHFLPNNRGELFFDHFRPFLAILTIFCHGLPGYLDYHGANIARQSISYHITAVNFFFDHCLPLSAIVFLATHDAKRAETHGCQFRQISAMLT